VNHGEATASAARSIEPSRRVLDGLRGSRHQSKIYGAAVLTAVGFTVASAIDGGFARAAPRRGRSNRA
jgi:hypothetical protein